MALLKRATRHIQAKGIDLQIIRGCYGPYLYDPKLRKQRGVVYKSIELAIAAAIAGERPVSTEEATAVCAPVCPFCGGAAHAKMCVELRTELGTKAMSSDEMNATLINRIAELMTERAALLEAAHEAHALLYHYDLAQQPNGANWGPVEMLRTEMIDKLWHAITLAQPELIISAS